MAGNTPFEPHRSYVLKQIRILDAVANSDRVGDIWLADGQIAAVGYPMDALPDGATAIDASDWIVGPGLVDLYAQSGEPGYEQRETFDSLARAALAGGFTQVALLPTTDPIADDPDRIAAIRDRRLPGQTPQWHPYAAFTQNAKGEALTELAELARSSASGFCDGNPVDDLPLLRRLLEYAQILEKPLLLWPQARSLSGGAMLEGEWSVRLGLNGISPVAETAAVAQVLELVRATETPVHLMRLTQARSFAQVDRAREEGLPVTASTTWMHLLLADRDIEPWHYHPALHLHAPLGSDEDRDAAIAAVRRGVLSAIATDHTPYTFEEKTVAFAEAPPGAIGLELALPLLWQILVDSNSLTALKLWQAFSTGPTNLLGLPALTLDLGAPANLALFAPRETWTVGSTTIHSLSAATPWWGKDLTGKVLGCWVDGEWRSSAKDGGSDS